MYGKRRVKAGGRTQRGERAERERSASFLAAGRGGRGLSKRKQTHGRSLEHHQSSESDRVAEHLRMSERLRDASGGVGRGEAGKAARGLAASESEGAVKAKEGEGRAHLSESDWRAKEDYRAGDEEDVFQDTCLGVRYEGGQRVEL